MAGVNASGAYSSLTAEVLARSGSATVSVEESEDEEGVRAGIAASMV